MIVVWHTENLLPWSFGLPSVHFPDPAPRDQPHTHEAPNMTRFILSLPRPPNWSAMASRKGPIPPTAGPRPEPGAEAHSVCSVVCHIRYWEWRADHHHSPTPNEASRLGRATMTTPMTIREWRNTFVPINHIPLDMLSLIPTHLSSHNDHFHTIFVCAIGAGPSSSVPSYGPSCSSLVARSMQKLSSDARRVPLDCKSGLL